MSVKVCVSLGIRVVYPLQTVKPQSVYISIYVECDYTPFCVFAKRNGSVKKRGRE